jgi:poly-gamma-glutamate synthesis protein (capsule biosynthesis protein)
MAHGLTLTLTGDVMTGRGIDQVLPHPGDPTLHEPDMRDARGYVALAERANGPIERPIGFADIWGDALPELERRRPDLRIINLETAVTTAATPAPKAVCYRMNPANAQCLTALGVDTCTLANNHVMDWGEAGLLETLDTLDGLGIATAGAGRDADAAVAPAILARPDGGRVLVFGIGAGDAGVPDDWAARGDRPGIWMLPGYNPVAVRGIVGHIRDWARPDDVVIASIHWGANWGYTVPREQQRLARALIDKAGVDVVHGHSSHHVKGIEVYGERLILYGCGDFLTDYEGIKGDAQYRDDLVLLYLPELDPASGALQRLTLTPFQLSGLRPRTPKTADVAWLRDVLNREGERLGTRVHLGDDGRLGLAWR